MLTVSWLESQPFNNQFAPALRLSNFAGVRSKARQRACSCANFIWCPKLEPRRQLPTRQLLCKSSRGIELASFLATRNAPGGGAGVQTGPATENSRSSCGPTQFTRDLNWDLEETSIKRANSTGSSIQPSTSQREVRQWRHLRSLN